MEELAKVLTIVSKHTDVTRYDILNGRSRKYTDARGIVTHLIMNGLPHLKKTFLEMSERTPDAFYKSAQTADVMVKNNFVYRDTMNRIRSELGLPVLKYDESKPVSATMRLFGFDYTDADIMFREKILLDSAKYMAKICSVGRKPMEGAMVYSVVRKPNIRQWYRDKA